MIFRLSQSEPVHQNSGGNIQIADSKNFPMSKTVAAGLVVLEPGACASCTGTPTPTSGSTTCKARRG